MQSVAALKKEQAQSETAWGEFVLFVSSKFLLPSANLEGAALEEAFAKAASSALFSVT